MQESTGGKKSREQLETEKRAILKQRIVPLQIDGLDQSGLASKAKELHKLIYRLEGEKYDLEKRFKSQQIDVSSNTSNDSVRTLTLTLDPGVFRLSLVELDDVLADLLTSLWEHCGRWRPSVPGRLS